jgi:hypothetical protein
MSEITNKTMFKNALSSLSLAKQRQVGAKFILNVLDLTDESCIKYTQQVAEDSNITPEELEYMHRAVYSIYVATTPSSGFAELDYTKLAAHFVAEACMVCLAPTYGESQPIYLAEKVASYCSMARMCTNILHDEEVPKLMDAEVALKKEVYAQYKIVSEFLDND